MNVRFSWQSLWLGRREGNSKLVGMKIFPSIKNYSPVFMLVHDSELGGLIKHFVELRNDEVLVFMFIHGLDFVYFILSCCESKKSFYILLFFISRRSSSGLLEIFFFFFDSVRAEKDVKFKCDSNSNERIVEPFFHSTGLPVHCQVQLSRPRRDYCWTRRLSAEASSWLPSASSRRANAPRRCLGSRCPRARRGKFRLDSTRRSWSEKSFYYNAVQQPFDSATVRAGAGMDSGLLLLKARVV